MLVHAESDSLLQDGIARMASAGRRDALAHHESRPPFVEEEAVHRALYLAAHAGVRIQIVHVSSPVSADLVRREKADGRPVTMEICPHHLLLDLDDLARLGPYGVCAPALRDRALVERLWDSVLDGTADCLISDHSAYTLAEKEPGWDNIFDAPLGCQVIQETVPLVLDEAYHRRGMPLDAFVRFSSTNAARIAGLYPGRARCSRAPTPTSPSTTSRASGWSTPRASSSRRIRGRRSTGAGCGPGSYGRSSAARPSTPTARSSPSRASGAFLSCHDDYSLGVHLEPAVSGE